MTHMDPAVAGLVIMASILILGIGAAAFGMWLADLHRRRKERRDVVRCMEVRERANRSEGHECMY